MNDENYSTTIYNRVQTERVYEDSDPAENGGPLYDEVHEDVRREDNLYVNELENQEYDSVAVYPVGRQGRTSASLQPETGEYVLPDEPYSKAQDPHPGEPTEDEDISLEELLSPTKDQESDSEEPQVSDPEEPQGSDPEEPQGPDPEEPQENGSEMEADLPSPSSFTIQNSRAFSTREISPTSYSADDVSEGNESASASPEINLFVKVRNALRQAQLHMQMAWPVLYFALRDQRKMHGVMVLGCQCLFKSRADEMSHSTVYPEQLKITRIGKSI